ncbi:hypothetical protein ABVK25_000141 [Lepraria finkii]|uniref:ABM domain-containing protein n=1 Tax=Lepraria finkii TaxID=1340010 RepID=A0ABR4BPX9_9LECA
MTLPTLPFESTNCALNLLNPHTENHGTHNRDRHDPSQRGSRHQRSLVPAGKVWQSTLDTVSQQDGFQRAYYGREIENPSVVQLLVGEKFSKLGLLQAPPKIHRDPVYGPFAKHLMTIVDGPLTMHHANFTPHPPSAALSHTTSPVTEVLTCVLPSQDESFEKNVNKFLDIIKEKAEGGKAAAQGWIIEDVEHENLGAGKKGKAFVCMMGWESLDAHLKFRETSDFKDNIHLLREGPVGVEVHHTAFVET